MSGTSHTGQDAPDFDAVVVGAGFAGLYMLHRLRNLMGLSVRVFEAGGGVGGTWYWNRYPGARCDVESVFYSYQFDEDLQQEWSWTERYAAQPEILTYANHVAERFDLTRDIAFDTAVTAARWDEAGRRWHVTTSAGEDGARETVTARYCIMATGCLSAANLPDIPGRDDFAGPLYHTGRWPHEGVDFSGMRVGVIGTGSSGIQSIPEIAKQADRVTVFQRTANYVVPAWNGPMDPDYEAAVKAAYPALRAKARTTLSGNIFAVSEVSAHEVAPADRTAEYERRWREGGLGFMASFRDLLTDRAANDTAAEFVRAKIRDAVADRETADRLSPDNVIGCKRLCVANGYYETFNRDNVDLVDLAETPIERIVAEGVEVEGGPNGEGKLYPLDALVFATGFDAMTGALARIDITGVDGERLADRWAAGPRCYLGLSPSGFPNLFTITGPGSPSVFTNMLPTIEQHVEWIAACIADMAAGGFTRIESDRGREDEWVAHVTDSASVSLRSTCSSWYLGANIEGKPRVFMPYIRGFPAYIEVCERVVAAGYDGLARS